MVLIIESILAVFLTILVTVILYIKRKYTYLSKKGLYNPKPSFFFGNARRAFLKQQQFQLFWAEVYNEIKSKKLRHGGAYFLAAPFYIPVDLEIVKSILQTDFQHFVGRGLYVNDEADPLGSNLFNLTNERWRHLRVKLTPTFTSGKMKMMFNTLASCANGLKDIIAEAAETQSSLEIKEILQRFTMDIIGSCAFGLDCNTMKNPDSDFATYGKGIFIFDTVLLLKNFFQLVVPEALLNYFNVSLLRPETTDFFTNLTKETINYREKNNVYRKDFMHLLLQLKNRGELVDDGKLFGDGEIKENTLTVNEIAAQVFVFFVAGFESSSTTMSFALYELAQRPDLQDKIRKELVEVLGKYDNKLTYDAVKDMTYLEQVVEETLRKYPPVSEMPRLCNKDYKIPGTDVVIEENERVSISVYGIHHDPEIYPDPEMFDPDRFGKENKANRHQFAWLPFGAGPRVCIGLRFGMMQVKVGLATILKDYRVCLNEKTKIPLEFDCNSPFILAAKDSVWVNVEKINN